MIKKYLNFPNGIQNLPRNKSSAPGTMPCAIPHIKGVYKEWPLIFLSTVPCNLKDNFKF